VTGRWFMRLTTGSGVMRADLRLDRRGDVLTGALVLETSDGPPVPIREGRIEAGGGFTFVVDAPEAMQFTGRLVGADLAGQVALERGRIWAWTAQRLPEGAEFYAALPRFRASQLVIGRNLDELTLPGAWVAAAGTESGIPQRAAALAEAAGLSPIPADSIRAYGFLPSMGLSRRDLLVPAMTGALMGIRARLPREEQAGFDALFRPRGAWVLDLYDAALAVARQRYRTLGWEDARPALAAAGLLPANQPPGTALVPLAVYRLAVLRAQDSAGYESALGRLSRGGRPAAQATEALVDGFRAAAAWQAQAVAFLLTARWLEDGNRRISPAAVVQEAWGGEALPVPAIETHFFGYPEAVPSVGIPPGAAARVVGPDNWAGEQWIAARGAPDLLRVLHQLELRLGANLTLDADGPSFLTTVGREAAASVAGFLEPRDAIVQDPGAPPLFALATSIHEWQHLLMERHRLSLAEGGTLQPDGAGLRVVSSDLFLAEGFAEWMSERVLAPVVAQVPLVGVGDAWKLAVLEANNSADPHVLGLLMMRALETALGGAEQARAAILADGDAPAAVAARVPAWRTSALPDRRVPVQGRRRIVPETLFSVEDGVGDVQSAVIHVSPLGGAAR